MQGKQKIYYNEPYIDRTPRIVSALMDEMNEITLTTSQPFSITDPIVLREGVNEVAVREVRAFRAEDGSFTNKVRVVAEQNFDLTKTYTISKDSFGEATVEIGKVVRSQSFDETFYYAGNDLGNTYTSEQTKFRLWAPTASEAKLVIYPTWDSTTGNEFAMQRGEKGTWTHTLDGDQKGLIYTYKVKIGDAWNEAVDPYARAVTVNGDRGAVVNLDETDPAEWANHGKPELVNPEDTIIYELHVRDLSIHPESGITHKGKFLGVIETGTRGPNGVKTGLDHIKDLGVTHVQFIPIYDYNTVDETKLDTPQINWGYDPKNYNAPDGSYSTNPYEPTVRINELKQMVKGLHDNGLRIIMDVVYNHMYDANQSNFHKLVPGYYFRYDDNGSLTNGTGVGNDTASERKMMRKFIVDSVKYWVTEYQLDGFRFDLMGIHDVETMNEVRAALDAIDPSIVIIGEGWHMGTLPDDQKASQRNAYKMEGIGHFNDDFRDGLKGSVFFDGDKGFVNGKEGMEHRIKKGVVGGIDYSADIATFGKDPEQVVTYVEAHDNHTLWDKLELTNPEASIDDRKKMHRLASTIVLTSQGVTFLHAGQEFMRTKYGDHNSYKSPDSINQLDWERRAQFDAEVEYFKGLIELRKSHPGFRMTTAADIRENLKFLDAAKNVVAYTIHEKTNGNRTKLLVVAHNANQQAVELTLPFTGPWNVLVEGQQAGNETLRTFKGNKIVVPALSSIVMESTAVLNPSAEKDKGK